MKFKFPRGRGREREREKIKKKKKRTTNNSRTLTTTTTILLHEWFEYLPPPLKDRIQKIQLPCYLTCKKPPGGTGK